MSWASVKRWGKKLVWPAVGVAVGATIGGLLGAPVLLAVGLAVAGVAGAALIGKAFGKRPSPLAYVAGGVLGTVIGAASIATGTSLLATSAVSEAAVVVGTGAGGGIAGGAGGSVVTLFLDDDMGAADLGMATDWKDERELEAERREEEHEERLAEDRREAERLSEERLAEDRREAEREPDRPPTAGIRGGLLGGNEDF